MEGFLPIFFLLVVLKIPVLGALWLIWWAAKEPGGEVSDESGGGPERWRPLRPRPRGPECGPGTVGRGGVPLPLAGFFAGRAPALDKRSVRKTGRRRAREAPHPSSQIRD